MIVGHPIDVAPGQHRLMALSISWIRVSLTESHLRLKFVGQTRMALGGTSRGSSWFRQVSTSRRCGCDLEDFTGRAARSIYGAITCKDENLHPFKLLTGHFCSPLSGERRAEAACQSSSGLVRMSVTHNVITSSAGSAITCSFRLEVCSATGPAPTCRSRRSTICLSRHRVESVQASPARSSDREDQR